MSNRSTINSSICSLIGDQGLVMSEDGGLLQWKDQSGCDCDAFPIDGVKGVVKPNYLNGKSVVGVGPKLKIPVLSSNEYTFFALVQLGAVKHPAMVFLGSNYAPGARWALGTGSQPSQGAGWAGANANVNLGDANFINVNEWKLLTYVKNGSQWSIFVNGSFVRSVNDSSFPAYPDSHDWVIGREAISSGDYDFQGCLAELLICEDALKNGQRRKVENEIKEYWGLL